MTSKDLIVCKNFKLTKKLGTGAFGQIYLAQNRTNPNQKYAAKLEESSTKYPQLYLEAKFYKYLSSSGSVVGIPKVYAMATEGKYNIMLMDLLGKSLEDLFISLDKKFTLKTTLMLVEQMVNRIEYLHERQIIHRDIKPENFLMGVGNKKHLVYVVDLGLSKKFMKDNQHIPYKQGKQLTGTARYASINTHLGIEQSRRDDLQSIGYVMMYFLKGILPWQNMKAKDTKTKYSMIMEKKKSTPAEVLCKGYPLELATFINYTKGLKFEEKPDYDYLKSLLNSAKKNNKIITDYVYDWTSQIQIQLETTKIQEEMKKVEKNTLQSPINNQVNNNKFSNILINAVNKPNLPISYAHKSEVNTSTHHQNSVENTILGKIKSKPTNIINQSNMTSNIVGPKIKMIKR